MQGSLDGAMMTTRPSGQEQDDGPVAEALARALCTRHTPPRAHIAAAAQRLGPTLDFTPPNHGGVQ